MNNVTDDISVDSRDDGFWVVWKGKDHRGPWDTREAADEFIDRLRKNLLWKASPEGRAYMEKVNRHS